ncbi:receptor like protein kinase S.2-like [Euphorbia lathyris]|uniref:receptor like protein kinase S.2-like n=1 Tax=Euphorbia lathyris TaxID=212925 RepID=UPI003313B2DD
MTGVDFFKNTDYGRVDLNMVELDKFVANDRVDFNKSLDDEVVHMNWFESDKFMADDDGVDLDKSIDDEMVDWNNSMDNDFAKVTGARKVSYKDLVQATNNFSEQDKLGEGSFGAVYRGFSNELNCYVAVKRVSRDSKQGIKEYTYEVKIISQLRHRNIVKLMGWCHERKELLLVYEFMSNGSLDSHLFKENRLLTWEMRYKIALGFASGLLYLHEEWEKYVVHRDIKAGNIMLDSDFNPKLGDFGLARLAEHGKGLEYTALAGTIGYVSPEYATTGRASKESDVYSFGIVALEIACGRKIINLKAREDQINLREWVWDLYGEGKLLEAADPRLDIYFNELQVKRLMIVGLWCAHPDEKSRPTMEKAIQVLKFHAPCPILPSKRPMVSYFSPFSMSSDSSVTMSEESRSQPPRLGNNYMVHRTNNMPEQEKLGLGGFGTIYKGILNELNSYIPVKNSMLGFWNRNKQNKEVIDILRSTGLRMFSYKDLVHATHNFSKENILEVEDFCTVYKGFWKEENMYISIERRLNISDQQVEEYAHRIMIFSGLHHRNLVRLIGWCQERKEFCFVFEFMPNSSLDYYLFSRKDNMLTWELRYRIVQNLASVLHFLHETADECIVHGDIKSRNVMLDSNFTAKLAFCPAKLKNHFVPDLVGTPVYVAPEYILTGENSRKSDVYSFGLVALEIASGRRPRDPTNYDYDMVKWVWDLYGEQKQLEAADPRLDGNFDVKQMECLLVLGLWCSHPNPNFRPSARQAIRVLNFEDSLPLLPRIRPLFTWPPNPPLSL